MRSQLIQFAMSEGPFISAQCTLVNIRFLLDIFKEVAGTVFLWLPDMSPLTNTLCIAHVKRANRMRLVTMGR